MVPKMNTGNTGSNQKNLSVSPVSFVTTGGNQMDRWKVSTRGPES